jgi:hypothetical protein
MLKPNSTPFMDSKELSNLILSCAEDAQPNPKRVTAADIDRMVADSVRKSFDQSKAAARIGASDGEAAELLSRYMAAWKERRANQLTIQE